MSFEGMVWDVWQTYITQCNTLSYGMILWYCLRFRPSVYLMLSLPSDRSWTINKCGPFDFPPGRMSWACTTACVAVFASPPTHHFVLVNVGEWISNSSVSGRYVAVVSSRETSDPWPSSVWAYAPMIASFLALSPKSWTCSGEPWERMTGWNAKFHECWWEVRAWLSLWLTD